MSEYTSRIDNIVIDYENGILIINGKKITSPLVVTVKEPDGWDIKKLFNYEKAHQGMLYPEVIIDASAFFDGLQKQEFKELIRDVIKETFPAKLAD